MKCGPILWTLVGIALPLSASAQDAQFSVYGTLLPFVDNFRTTGATATRPLARDRRRESGHCE